jgi:hypothetical protein
MQEFFQQVSIKAFDMWFCREKVLGLSSPLGSETGSTTAGSFETPAENSCVLIAVEHSKEVLQAKTIAEQLPSSLGNNEFPADMSTSLNTMDIQPAGNYQESIHRDFLGTSYPFHLSQEKAGECPGFSHQQLGMPFNPLMNPSPYRTGSCFDNVFDDFVTCCRNGHHAASSVNAPDMEIHSCNLLRNGVANISQSASKGPALSSHNNFNNFYEDSASEFSMNNNNSLNKVPETMSLEIADMFAEDFTNAEDYAPIPNPDSTGK